MPRATMPTATAPRLARRSLAAVVLLLGAGAGTASAQPITLADPGGAFDTSTDPPTLARYNVTVMQAQAPLANAAVTLQYRDPSGNAVGGPVAVTTGANGQISVPPPPIPAGATPFGGSVEVSHTDINGIVQTAAKKVRWNDYRWFWQYTPNWQIKLGSLGLPGSPGTRHWALGDVVNARQGIALGGHTLAGPLAGSGFDVSYTALGGGVFEARVVGDASFTRVGSDAYLSFVDGQLLGTVRVVGSTATSATGAFDFSALGISGEWQWSAAGDQTTGSVTSFASSSGGGALHTPGIVLTAVPEPATLLLCGGGLLALAAVRKRARR